ncbi:carbamoyl-phosphate synthase large subunit [Miltoncostaea marina]|uniref:carbamoyl-phosphate synthase large subunit n=1 Tax=Miltoncostaea marina TaxID=2843215 RepID=UPI001C3DB645|nr:carbamoyl-phosphate synthase large subunit [Miltoncostaea marina]
MPRRDDLRTILILGSGPIVIGQAGEFDYSGTQGARALTAEGYRVVLVNSNPATIMTDPSVADRTYVEPLDAEAVEAVIAAERPDALLPTLGGQTALNLAMELSAAGVLDRYGVELIGADVDAIRRAEDREVFRDTMAAAGLAVPESRIVTDLAGGRAAAAELGLPVILRPGFTLGGEGGGAAHTPEELDARLATALDASPIGQVLVERSVLGWAEIELEVVRDVADNAVIVCSIENVDPMGVHTGDSVTVAPVMTLTDPELQRLRDAALAVIRAVGVSTGGANVQFALDRATGDFVVIEMNPRVSRSSALASKATGFPIAKIAARLAVGYTLDELPNEITGVTPASFEPTLDYVAVKMPRFAFEKVPGASAELTTHMKSVGEVLALGRTFGQAFGKAMAGRELDVPAREPAGVAEALERLRTPSADRYDVLMWALGAGAAEPDVVAATSIDPWFVAQLAALARARAGVARPLEELDGAALRAARRAGLSDRDVAAAAGADELAVGRRRRALGVRPTYHAVDTCGAEFAARTPYYYAAFETESELERDDREAVVVLGSGPNRIGQGIEFDYCCVHAAETARELGHAAVMVNCNPETVSTDHGVSDRLYLEPVTLDSVLDICEAERPRGVIAQLGGQTPLRLARALADEGVPILGTPPEAIDLAEDRGRFGALLSRLGLEAPPWAVAATPDEAAAAAAEVGYPVLVRPSYVLGGRAMAVCDSPEALRAYLERERPSGQLLVDRFLEGAVELDVDALADGADCWTAAVMEHVEAAGVHSGDSACVLPAQSAGPGLIAELEEQTAALAAALGVVGLLNVQYAVRDGRIHVIEANPRASRTVPFVAKATGVPLVRHAVRLMLGASLADLGLPAAAPARHVAVKEAVLPFSRFPGADPVLGPEMRATGEVMGLGGSFAEAFAKAQRGAGQALPSSGAVVLSARDRDKPRAVALAARLARAGLDVIATAGTAAAVAAAGIPVRRVNKVSEGSPHIADLIARGDVALVVTTPRGGQGARTDGSSIRAAAVRAGIPYITTIEAAEAAGAAIARPPGAAPRALQDAGLPMRAGRAFRPGAVVVSTST